MSHGWDLFYCNSHTFQEEDVEEEEVRGDKENEETETIYKA